MRKNSFLWSCFIALCIGLLTIPRATVAQTITGSVTGTVTDSTGAVVSGATVTATNVATGVATPTTTNANGIYNIRFLQIGHYKVTTEANGFMDRE